MKKLLFLFFVLVITGSSIFAQQMQTKTAEERANIIYSKINEVVQITDAQKPKVHSIILKREQGRDADRKEFSADKEALKKAAEARNQERDEELKASLTAEQYIKLLEYRKEMQQKQQKKNAPAQQEETGENL